MTHDHGGDTGLLPLLVLAVAIGYEVLLLRPVRGAVRGWSFWRAMSFLAGCALLMVGLTPDVLPHSPDDFRSHMTQHLIIGMLTPLLLMLGAPVTLLLRTLPTRNARRVGRLLHSQPVRVIAHPVTALTLNLGGLALLYLTPLYATTMTDANLHRLVHVHFLLAGYLFAWVVAGPDPAPRRPSVPARLVVLGVAVAAHAVLSQLLYAGAYVHVPVPAAQRQGGAELMYYGGDIAELLLALALLNTWRPSPLTKASRPPRIRPTSLTASGTCRRLRCRQRGPRPSS